MYLFRGADGGGLAAGEVLLPKIDRPEGDTYKGYGYSLLQAGALSPADWDADGDVDLIAGNVDGRVFLLRNGGTSREPRFGAPETLVGPRFPKSGPCAADWDGDGDLDLLVGTETDGVFLLRNDGTAKEPKIGEPKVLFARAGALGKAYRFKPFVTDWNGDGRPDLLFGACLPGEDRTLHGHVWVCLRK